MGSIRRKAHPLPQNAHSIGQYSSGAMEDMSGKVQNANTHILGSQNHEHAHSSQSVQGPVSRGRWMKVQGNGRRQAHQRSRVVMDIAAFKNSHSVGGDIDTTALRAKKWSA